MHSEYDYVIVGGGMVADAAADGIRERDADGTIAILGEEPTGPFPRPALSKKLWTDPDFTVENTDPGTAARTGADVVTGTRVVSIDRHSQTVETAAGDVVAYGSLLLATGGSPRTIHGLEPGERVIYFRSLTDYLALRGLSEQQPHLAVVGGSYIGTEIAAALVQNGCRVTLVFQEETLGCAIFPESLALEFDKTFRDRDVTLVPGTSVEGGEVTEGPGGSVTLHLAHDEDDSDLTVDAVIIGLGIGPNGQLAAADGLVLADDGGIVVDERLATNDPHVFAAGDVAQYPDPILGRRRVEHVDNATEMGATVGRVMAGSDETYTHTPYFYSEVFDIAYEAVGSLDASGETEVVEIDEARGGGRVVYYLDGPEDGGEVTGVLLWNTGDALDQAREVLAAHTRPASYDGLITPTAG